MDPAFLFSLVTDTLFGRDCTHFSNNGQRSIVLTLLVPPLLVYLVLFTVLDWLIWKALLVFSDFSR